MDVNILAFGIAREILGNGNVRVPAVEDMSVGDVRAELEREYPRLRELKSFTIAVNGAYASLDTQIKAGDELAIIPPVSGG